MATFIAGRLLGLRVLWETSASALPFSRCDVAARRDFRASRSAAVDAMICGRILARLAAFAQCRALAAL
jgi:hypothetical protein